MNFLYLLIIVFVVGLFLYWQFIIAEGAYFGARLVALLYDWTAERYNSLKEFEDKFEDEAIGEPLANRLYQQPTATVLDVATGTGRVPLILFRLSSYQGKVIGLDRASKMLAIARRDTAAYHNRITFIQADAMALPFVSNCLPMVTCLEALEFLPHPEKGLHELVRVLAASSPKTPDHGWLMTSNRIGWEARLMPGKTWRREQLVAILNRLPLRYIDILPWETIYDMLFCQKTITTYLAVLKCNDVWNTNDTK